MRIILLLGIISAGLSLGCDSNPFNPSPAPCEGDNCDSQSSSSTVSSTSSNSSSTSSGSSSDSSGSSGSTPIGISSGSGGGSSTGSGSTSSASTGGFVTGSPGGGSSGGGSTSPNNNVRYDSPGGYANYFSKINEPLDQQVEISHPFAFKFVAVGKMPLKYKWFKVNPNGNTSELSNDTTAFAKANATASDAGFYYATVEDSEGNILTSRRAQLIVNPKRINCNAGRYGPKYDSTKNAFDYRTLVPEAEMTNKTGVSVVSIGAEIDGYAYSISKCAYHEGSGNTCAGDNTLVQCQNGNYFVMSTNCHCYQEDTGGS